MFCRISYLVSSRITNRILIQNIRIRIFAQISGVGLDIKFSIQLGRISSILPNTKAGYPEAGYPATLISSPNYEAVYQMWHQDAVLQFRFSGQVQAHVIFLILKM